MAKVTVTGATGLLGGNLAEALRQAGHAVRCTRRATSKTGHLDHLELEWVEADLGDREALARAFDGAEAVFHCAAMVSIERRVSPALQRTNVDGTQNVIDAMRMVSAGRLIHCSSTVTVGLSVDGVTPSDETAPFNFAEHGLDDGYVITKRAAEERVRAAVAEGLDAVVVNPGFMFGPYDVGPSSGKMIIDVVRGRVPGMSTGRNCFADARAVARGMVAAWQKGAAGERYILGGENRSYGEMFRAIASTAGVKPPRFVAPRWLATIAAAASELGGKLSGGDPLVNRNTIAWGYCPRFIFTSDKARRALGYDPGSPDAGVAAALDWFRASGRL